MNPNATRTAHALYCDGTFTLEQAAAYLGWSPAHVRARFGPQFTTGGSAGRAAD